MLSAFSLYSSSTCLHQPPPVTEGCRCFQSRRHKRPSALPCRLNTAPPERQQRLTCQAKKGSGGGATKAKNRKSASCADKGAPRPVSDPDWIEVAKVSEFPASGRPTLPVILKDRSAVVLYRVGRDVYCSDANSTAFKFPLVDAKLLERDRGPAVEVPLDGTVYDLGTGRVLEWCPRNNPVRMLLGSLKARADPEPLKVYPARVRDDGTVLVKFAPGP